MSSNPARESFHLMLKVRKPLISCERMDRETDADWVASVHQLLTQREDGSYPWQQVEYAEGEVVEFKTLEAFIQAEDGLRTSPARMLKLLEADPIEGASEAAELLRSALTRGPGNPTGANQHAGGMVDNVNDSSVPAKATGNSRARVIREIRQLAESDDPRAATAADLLDRVHARDISANAAAIQLGLRSKALNFDLYKLTPEVRGEIENLKVQEDWTTAEVIEEALRAYFRILTAEEELEPVAVQPSPRRKQPALPAATGESGTEISQVDVADLCGINRNSIGHFVRKAHRNGQDAELTSKDGTRMFVRHVGARSWEEVV
jgi:hypothetical protein